MKEAVSIISLICFSSLCLGQSNAFTAAQVNQDLTFLRKKLEANHPNLYLYSSKVLVDSVFDDLLQHIPEGMTELEVYRYITPICSVVKDGHTIILPSKQSTEYYHQYALFFPFKVFWDGTKMFVELNYSREKLIEDGAEIIEINGIAVDSIMRYTLPRMMRDGENLSYPIWVLNNWFNEYFSYFFGHPKTFKIGYRTEDGKRGEKNVNALFLKSILENRKLTYPHRVFEKQANHGIELTIDDNLKTAVLTIRDFHNAILKKQYKQHFGKTIAGYFATIKANDIQHLILDIRNNQGGDIGNGEILLTHLMTDTFRLVNGYYKVRKLIKQAFHDRNRKALGATKRIHPNKDAFKGKLYVLVNGGSFSNSGIVCSALKYYKRGLMIGEETGGNGSVISGGNIKNVTLPNSKIRVEVPILQFVIRDKSSNNGRGVIPEYHIQPTIIQMVDGKDAALEYVIQLINNSQ